jgi:hypothetical protein
MGVWAWALPMAAKVAKAAAVWMKWRLFMGSPVV